MKRICRMVLLAGWLAALWNVASGAASRPVVELKGDQVFTTKEKWQGKHYKILGNLILDAGADLTVEDCTIELMCTYARQFKFIWRNDGIMRTIDSKVGGSNHTGAAASVAFEVSRGWWYATNTVIEYSSGILFDWDTPGHFYATDLKKGVQPDTIIVTGAADVQLTGGTFDVSLFASGNAGGTTTLDLPTKEPLSAVFDKVNIPGARYCLKLDKTTVEGWFVFFYDVRNTGLPTTYKLKRCPWFLPNLMGRDLKGTVHLPCTWSGTEAPGAWKKTLPENTVVDCGTLRVAFPVGEVSIPGWGVYLSGTESDLTLTGPTRICELMVTDGGKCRLQGSPGTHDVWCTATTVDATGAGDKTSSIDFRNVSLGWFSDLWAAQGQVTAHDKSAITISETLCDDLILRTEGSGTITVPSHTGKGKFKVMKEGGEISVDPGINTH